MRNITLLIILLVSVCASAQRTELSSYSRFGLGDPDIGAYPTQFGMGSGGVALIDGIHLNPFNPATQAFLLSPAFEFGLSTERLTTTSDLGSVTNSKTRFNHFAVGFPMWGGKWGASFGLSPYTGVGYKNSETIYDETQGESFTAEYIGDGGINKMFLELGRRIAISKDTSRYAQHSYLALGGGFNYMFGSIASERNAVFPLSSGFISTRIEDATTISDFTFNSGVLIRHFLDKRTSKEDSLFSVLNFGGSFLVGGDLSAHKTRDVFGFVQNASGIEFSRDSINTIDDVKGTVSMPSTFRLGTSYEFYREKKDRRNVWRKYTISADYSLTDWSDIGENFGSDIKYDGLGEQHNISMGLAYRPNTSVGATDRAKHWQLATYRLGFRTGNSHLAIDDQVLQESGISFGMNIPLLTGGIKRSDTQFDIAVEYGSRGNTDAGLLKEDFLRVMVGFSFHPEGYDQWFKKRKYD